MSDLNFDNMMRRGIAIQVNQLLKALAFHVNMKVNKHVLGHGYAPTYENNENVVALSCHELLELREMCKLVSVAVVL